jgi:hypothetical protein
MTGVTTQSRSQTTTNCSPFFVALIARFGLREAITRRRAVGLVIGFAGVRAGSSSACTGGAGLAIAGAPRSYRGPRQALSNGDEPPSTWSDRASRPDIAVRSVDRCLSRWLAFAW